MVMQTAKTGDETRAKTTTITILPMMTEALPSSHQKANKALLINVSYNFCSLCQLFLS